MFKTLAVRLGQGHRTLKYPDAPAVLPERFVGLPKLDGDLCQSGCSACAEVCPTEAVKVGPQGLESLDLGRCLFCSGCARACPTGAVVFTPEFAMATRTRQDLHLEGQSLNLAQALERKSLKLFGRSLRLRQVSAGGCNGCEAEVNALNNVIFDLGRFGVGFVASPRHADGLLITGPISQNMREALLNTYAAVPEPRLVIALGACAISGGPYLDHPEVNNGCGELVPVDLYVPGCPPHPLTILDGILRLLGRLAGPRSGLPLNEEKQ